MTVIVIIETSKCAIKFLYLDQRGPDKQVTELYHDTYDMAT